MKIKFTSKARTLENLRSLSMTQKNLHFSILPIHVVDAKDVAAEIEKVVGGIQTFAKNINANKLIFRSSSPAEDAIEQSNAGAFLSINDINAFDEEIVKNALLNVASSMPCGAENEILVQPSLQKTLMCGVVFTKDKDNLSPYFCVNYDEGGSTSSITGGTASETEKYFFHFRDAEAPSDVFMARLINACKELENIFGNDALDIEFAFTGGETYKSENNAEEIFPENVPVILQVRPIVCSGKDDSSCAITKKSLDRLRARFVSLQRSPPNILGDRAIFSVMTDWNPAEIVGLRPKHLALSLYKEIITDDIWSKQRANYGYRELGPLPLIHSFLGIPFVDVRASFNSFLPRDLDERIAEKLVNFYLTKLATKSELHDKVEFEIVYSCYTFSTAKKLEELYNAGFNANEVKRIEFALLQLTNSIISAKNGYYLNDLQKVQKLQKIFDEIDSAKFSAIDKIYQFLGECKKFGTLPFAGIARAAFIAVSILNSLVDIGFFTETERSEFLNSLFTVSKKLSAELQQAKSTGDFSGFIKKFGHLRAGTYDIMSPRYDEDFYRYFNVDGTVESKAENNFTLSDEKKATLDNLLRENGFLIDAESLFAFFKTAIEGREFSKFEFTRLLSAAISQIADEIGSQYDISRSDLAYVDIHDILNLYSTLSSKSPRERLLEQIHHNKIEYETAQAVKLPQVLLSEGQIFSFFSNAQRPNFITQKKLTGKSFFMQNYSNSIDLHGKIVLIESADPGWDFLFAKGIAALITCYGGANSHMAIRASELALPAAIGCGAELFEKLCKCQTIHLDCVQEKIEVIY